MVQQLLLTASVSKAQFVPFKIALQTLTGMNPEPLARHTVILQPKFPYIPEKTVTKADPVETYRIRMTRVWNEPSAGDIADDNERDLKSNDDTDGVNESANSAGNSGKKFDKAPEIVTAGSRQDCQSPIGDSVFDQSPETSRNNSIWTIQLSDIPAAGKRPVSIQNIYEATIYKTDDVLGYVDELGYMPETEFWARGLRFYYNDIVVIEVLRLYISSKPTSAGNRSVPLRPVDSSVSYHVRCFVDVANLNDLDNVARGVKQLEHLRTQLAGLIDLHVPDRRNMDSRLNSHIASVGPR